MKRRLLLLSSCLVGMLTFAQKGAPNHLWCTQHQKVSEMQTKDPARFATINRLPTPEVVEKSTGLVYVIPVVFHVLHNNGSENISDAQIEDQLNILNRDFRLQNADAANVAAPFQGMPSDVEVEFRFATIAPNGSCFNGITRTVTAMTSDGSDGQLQVNAVVAGNNIYQGVWAHNKYLNIYVCDDLGGAAGYTFNPNGTSTANAQNMYYNGVFILHDYCGSIGTSSVLTSRALTHEVGHWLNLEHTWGPNNNPGNAASCADDDGVQDTPMCIGVTSCNLNSNTCNDTNDPNNYSSWTTNVIDNVENYMDYSYCSKMYTQGQVDRMRAAIVSTVGGRSNIWTTTNLQAVGATSGGSACAIDFDSDQTSFCTGTTVTYTASTAINIASYSWSFPGGTPATSTAASPTVTYNTPGIYDVTLSITEVSTGTVYTKTKTAYITANAAPATATLPISQGFASATFPPTGWSLRNVTTSTVTWDRSSSVGVAPTAGNSLRFDNYNTQDNGEDEFKSPQFDLTNYTSATLTFQVAYAPYDATNFDGLRVLVGSDCGSWTSEYFKSNTTLATASATQNAFVPTAAQWRTETIDLTPYVGNADVQVNFVNVPGYGNMLYIDNINITGLTGPPVAPTANFSPSATTVCAGTTVNFTNGSTGTNNTYSWTFPGGSPATSTSTNPTVTYSTAGTYSATLTATNTGGTNTTNQTITVNPTPTVSFSAVPAPCVNHAPFTLTQGSPAGGTYSGTGVTGGQTFNPATAGVGNTTLTYTYTDGNGCTNSSTRVVTVNSCLGLDEALLNGLSVFPNPADQVMQINSDNAIITGIQVYDQSGRLVENVSGNETTSVELNLARFANGVYNLHVSTGVNATILRVVISH